MEYARRLLDNRRERLSTALLSNTELEGVRLREAMRTHAVPERPVTLQTQRVIGVRLDDAAVQEDGPPLAARDAPVAGPHPRPTLTSRGLP